MKLFFVTTTLLLTSIVNAATPIDGWYSSAFGGYTYLPGNINQSNATNSINNVVYQSGYDAGFSFGYKNNPLRYEAQLTYLDANVDHFNTNGLLATNPSGYNNAIFGLANVYYDFSEIVCLLQPFLGLGIGYGWIHNSLSNQNTLVTNSFNASSNVFSYQGTAGITYQFSENYALDLAYRYIGTQNVSALNDPFQAHIANLGVIYRFDGNRYK